MGFQVCWLFSLAFRPGFLPPWAYFRVRVSVAVFLSTEPPCSKLKKDLASEALAVGWVGTGSEWIAVQGPCGRMGCGPEALLEVQGPCGRIGCARVVLAREWVGLHCGRSGTLHPIHPDPLKLIGSEEVPGRASRGSAPAGLRTGLAGSEHNQPPARKQRWLTAAYHIQGFMFFRKGPPGS